MSITVTLFLLAAGLVILAGVFAAADAALGAVSRARVDELVRAGRGGAKGLASLIADRPRHINLLLLLRLACELAAVVFVTIAMQDIVTSDWAAMLSAVGTMLVVSYVLVGVGPRTLGRQHPYTIGIALAGPVRLLAKVLNPLTRLLILVGNAITPGRGFREGPFSSEVELRELVDLASDRGVVAAGEREMIHSVFELGDTIAREVMVPRTEIVWIEQHKTARQALALCLRTGFTRIPVISDSVDDIVGVVNFKDVARVVMDDRGDGAVRTMSELMRPAEFVPDSKRLDVLLKEMQVSRNHMAIAVDEYGGTAGLLTIEDILEEIVGEITDEYDTEERPPVEQLPDGDTRVSARLHVDDFGELYGIEFEDSDIETVGGLLAQRLGRVPLPGAIAEISGLRLVAEGGKDSRGRLRITTVLVTRLPELDDDAGDDRDRDRDRADRGDRDGRDGDRDRDGARGRRDRGDKHDRADKGDRKGDKKDRKADKAAKGDRDADHAGNGDGRADAQEADRDAAAADSRTTGDEAGSGGADPAGGTRQRSDARG